MTETAQQVATQHQQPPKLPTIAAGGAIRAIVPQDFDSAWRIANVIVKSGMAPKGLDTPEKAMVAVMHGLEIGLTPMAALQSIAVVNGKPTIYGDGAIGLVRASGLLENIEETIEDRNGDLTAVCTVKRKNESTVIIRTFSMSDAQQAGLKGKDGPWKTYPKRMLLMRARAFALRDGFADVLKGLSIREEVEDYRPMKDVTPAQDRDDGPPMPSMQPTVPPTNEIDNGGDHADLDPPVQRDQRGNAVIEATAEDVFDGGAWLKDLEGAASGCETLEQLSEIATTVQAEANGRVTASDWNRGVKIMKEAAMRIVSAEQDDGPPTPRLNLVAG